MNKRKKLSLVFILAAGLTLPLAGTPTANATDNANMTMSQNQQKPYTDIVTWGDSIAYGTGQAGRVGKKYNRGRVSASHWGGISYPVLGTLKPDTLVLISAGINDFNTIKGRDNGKTMLPKYETWLEQELKTIMAKGGKPVLILAKLDRPYRASSIAFAEKMAQTQIKVCERLGVAYLRQGPMYRDGLHPKSYKALYDRLIEKADSFYSVEKQSRAAPKPPKPL